MALWEIVDTHDNLPSDDKHNAAEPLFGIDHPPSTIIIGEHMLLPSSIKGNDSPASTTFPKMYSWAFVTFELLL